jgi:hypothetical protein
MPVFVHYFRAGRKKYPVQHQLSTAIVISGKAGIYPKYLRAAAKREI